LKDECAVVIQSTRKEMRGADLIISVLRYLLDSPNLQQWWDASQTMSEFHLTKRDYARLLADLSPDNVLDLGDCEVRVKHYEGDRRTNIVRNVPGYLPHAVVATILKDVHGPMAKISGLERARRTIRKNDPAFKYSVKTADCWYTVEGATCFPRKITIDRKDCDIFQQGECFMCRAPGHHARSPFCPTQIARQETLRTAAHTTAAAATAAQEEERRREATAQEETLRREAAVAAAAQEETRRQEEAAAAAAREEAQQQETVQRNEEETTGEQRTHQIVQEETHDTAAPEQLPEELTEPVDSSTLLGEPANNPFLEADTTTAAQQEEEVVHNEEEDDEGGNNVEGGDQDDRDQLEEDNDDDDDEEETDDNDDDDDPTFPATVALAPSVQPRRTLRSSTRPPVLSEKAKKAKEQAEKKAKAEAEKKGHAAWSKKPDDSWIQVPSKKNKQSTTETANLKKSRAKNKKQDLVSIGTAPPGSQGGAKSNVGS
jgi:hypothetical protein